MSIARVHRVKRSRKEQRCTAIACENPVIPVGSEYLWFAVGYRGRKQARHVDHYPRQSELESSALSAVYAAVEDAADAIRAIVPDRETAESLPDDIEAILGEVEEAAEEVADQYREAAEAMGEAGYEMEERADAVSEAGSEATGWSAEEDVVCDEHADDGYDPDCEDCVAAADRVKDSAIDHVEGLDFSA